MKSLIVLSALVACFMTVTANASVCREGQEEIFNTNNGGDTDTREIFVCKNGRFVPKFGAEPEYVRNPRNTCREGSVENFGRNTEGGAIDLFVCKGGRFVPMYRAEPQYIRNPRVLCREGKVEVFFEDNGSDTATPVQYVCHNGRFVRAYR